MISNDIRSGAEQLCSAVRELLTVFDRQQAAAQVARERAEASRAVFDRYMASFRTGAEPISREDRGETLLQALRTTSRPEDEHISLRESLALDRKWESSFCDVYEALISLNAHPEMQAAVAAMTEQVRTLRLLQIACREEGDPYEIPEPVGFPHFPTPGEARSRTELRKEHFESFDTAMTELDGYTSELSARLPFMRTYLEELLTTAEALHSAAQASLPTD